MATDYRRRARRRTRKQPVPAWAWFLAGLLPGLLMAGLVWQKCRSDCASPRTTVVLPVAPAEDIEPPPEPEFVMPAGDDRSELDLLQNEKPYRPAVPTPPPPPRQVTKPTPKPTATDKRRYLLQAGSFRTASQADRTKAKLALLGHSARIQTVKTSSGTWHRVQLGPYTGQAKAAAVRKQLSGQGIDTLIKRIGK